MKRLNLCSKNKIKKRKLTWLRYIIATLSNVNYARRLVPTYYRVKSFIIYDRRLVKNTMYSVRLIKNRKLYITICKSYWPKYHLYLAQRQHNKYLDNRFKLSICAAFWRLSLKKITAKRRIPRDDYD